MMRRGGASSPSSAYSSVSLPTCAGGAVVCLLLGAVTANILFLSSNSNSNRSNSLGDPRLVLPNVPSADARAVADATREELNVIRQRLQSIENILAEQHLLFQQQKSPSQSQPQPQPRPQSQPQSADCSQAVQFSREARDACQQQSTQVQKCIESVSSSSDSASASAPTVGGSDGDSDSGNDHRTHQGLAGGAGKAAAKAAAIDTKVVLEGQRAYIGQAMVGTGGNTGGTQSWRRQRLRERLLAHATIQRDIRSGARPPRYLRCTLINGWGNVLQEAISCMLLALVSERAILFDYRSVRGYMPFESFLNPDGFMPFQDAYNFRLMDELKKREEIIPRHNFTCLDWTKDIAGIEAINVHLTYDFWAPNLLVNPILGDKLLSELPRDYYAIIFHSLFKLRADIQRDVDAFKAAYFRGYVIGLQIRSASSTSQKGKVDHKGFPVAEIDLYAQTAHNLENFQDVVPVENVRWFVATQNLDMIGYLRDAYGESKILAVNGTITTTFDSHEEGQRVSLMTWWLLGEADDVLTSEASSFGTTAAVRTGITPIVCNHKKYCSRRLTPTPCQDTKFLVDQPMACLKELRTLPHHFISSPEATCGYWKHAIYSSKEYQDAQRKT